MTHRFASGSIAKHARGRFLPMLLPYLMAYTLLASHAGCRMSPPPAPPEPAQKRDASSADKLVSNQILAQGRIQPAKGLIRLTALPGDKVEQVLVAAGQSVRKLQPLIMMQSQKLRALELDAANLRLREAKSARLAKQQEADLAVDAAELKLRSAKQTLEQANAQLVLAQKGTEQVDSLGRQIASLQKLRDSDLTRAAIGTIELETKKNELVKVASVSEQTQLAAQQAVELSQLQVVQSDKTLAAAKESRKLVEQTVSIESLEKQIEILQLQLDQTNVVSPIDGIVVSVNAEPGERTAQLPLVEIADLSKMVCIAEVHESDVARIALGDPAEIRSSALERALRGRVQRIDRIVGAAQLRAPNPMARSDFRSIPVWIEIDADDIEMAAQRLQLQVDVSIHKTR